jgi:hypothetical protein
MQIVNCPSTYTQIGACRLRCTRSTSLILHVTICHIFQCLPFYILFEDYCFGLLALLSSVY